MNWTIEQMETLWRDITGKQSTNQVSQANVFMFLNDFYIYKLPKETDVGEAEGEETQLLAPSAVNNYDIPTIDSTIIEVRKPFFVDGSEIKVYMDKSDFYRRYPDDIDVQSDTAGLAIGSDTTKFTLGTFQYMINEYTYRHGSGTEYSLTGSAIPTGKYAAWLVEIDADDTVTVTAADDNATGYGSQRAALEGLPDQNTDRAIVGFIMIFNNSGGNFTPDTTGLDAANVNDYYVELKPNSFGVPEAVLIHDNTLHIRPHSSEVRQLRFSVTKRRTALTAGQSPENREWGEFIAYGSALFYMTRKKIPIKPEQLLSYRKAKDYVNHHQTMRTIDNMEVERAW